jgi:geranylgeranyl diphosphate synthase type II
MSARIEQALKAALAPLAADECAPGLAAAMRHAVFPGGARVRPRLCLAVAAACGDDAPGLSDAAAVAVELLHCASLVHDDLPCFDDADTRRGLPSVHAVHGEALALLAGDGLIVQAFGGIAAAAGAYSRRAVSLTAEIAAGVGAPRGIVAGQAWECEPNVCVQRYHALKTAALFVAAVCGGAIAAGRDPRPWRAVGERIGAAYQIADDLLDHAGSADAAGKPVGQDARLERPSAVRTLGVAGAVELLRRHVAEAANAVPDCPGAEALRETVRLQAARLVPRDLVLAVA